MKLYHIADLHFGKIIYGKSLLEEQTYWMEQFIQLCHKEKPDGVMIAGDVYDRTQPGKEAVQLLDEMITRLHQLHVPVLMIAGNHDSGQRLAFGSSILSSSDIHITGTLQNATIPHVTYHDAYGPVTFWMLPYIYPEQAAYLLQDDSIRTYQQAMEALISTQHIHTDERNVLIAHQNVVVDGNEIQRGGSESMVGGVGQIEHTVFAPFDYVALGHIHSSYPAGADTIRYAGTPLCYHFDELRQKDKGLLEVVLKEKGNISIRKTVIPPLHPMVALCDTKQNILDCLQNSPIRNSLVSITLTNQQVDASVYSLVRSILNDHGSLLLEMKSDYHRFDGQANTPQMDSLHTESVQELFCDLYMELSGGVPPEKEETAFMEKTSQLLQEYDIQEDGLQAAVDALVAWVHQEEER